MSTLSGEKLALVVEDYFAQLEAPRISAEVSLADFKTLRDAIELQSMRAIEMLRRYMLEVPS